MTLHASLSQERLARYKHWANGDIDTALELYALNMKVSEAFYPSLHVLEITLRNSIHDILSAQYGLGWFSNQQVITDAFLKRKISDAYRKLPNNPSDGQVIAELTLGYWSALFGRRHYMLWGDCLHTLFDASYPLKRKQIATRLDRIRNLRNRIAHHEPIIQQDLKSIHTEIRELIGWLSTDTLVWCDKYCRFAETHPPVPIIIGNLKNPALSLE